MSGSDDQTIKVWDAGRLAPKIDLTGPKLTVAPLSAGTLELKAEKQNAHTQKYGVSIMDVKFSPDGTKIVSCGVDQTIKVWDSGAFWISNRPLLGQI